MRISFANEDLEELCTMEKVAKKRLGPCDAAKLAKRLSQLEAAANFAEVKLGNPETKAGGLLTLHVGQKNRIVLEPDGAAPFNSSGQLLYASITEVTVVFVGDYHGQDIRKYHT